MNKTFLHSLALGLALALALAACSTTPLTTAALEQARSDYAAAQATPRVASFAPLEFKQATDALNEANAAAAKRDSLDRIDKLAYLAKQKTAIAQEVAKRKAAEAEVAGAGAQRDQMRLEARTAEADRAKADAERAQAQAAAAQSQTEEARRQAMAAENAAREAQAKSARLEAMLIELHAKKTERGMVITIGDVLFATDRASLTSGGMATARKLADVLSQYPNRKVLVEGFTDSRGSEAYNQQLSERRAGAVRDALAGMGIARDRIAMHGYGESFPVADNNTASNRQLNRRVEIVLSDESGTIAPR